MGLSEKIKQQFDHPKGWLGSVAGWWMALSGREINRWTVYNLEISPRDRVLDVGCGPGVGLKEAAKLAYKGSLAGVDPSPEMVAQARRRNRRLIDEEQMVVRLGSVSELPFSDNSFEKAFSVNCFDLWHDPVDDLKELLRVLKKGGMLAVTVCPPQNARDEGADDFGVRLQSLLSVVGFKEVRVLKLDARPQAALCVAGVKPLYNGSTEQGDPISFEWMSWEAIYQRERIPDNWH